MLFRYRRRSVHPRACGEHPSLSDPWRYDSGSSPRLRGTRGASAAMAEQRRFIPAPAGNTSKNSWRRSATSVHPRACGEHTASNGGAGSYFGSSPRLRGTLGQRVARYSWMRFIPAPAGNTLSRSGRVPGWPVHPRACGEHVQTDTLVEHINGSSPRLRGTRAGAGRADAAVRFIPAPAGNTCGLSPASASATVHPRACGEHFMSGPREAVRCGSSPRLRGTPVTTAGDVLFSRFIPAPAGNTASHRAARPCRSVHPRACGEHTSNSGL